MGLSERRMESDKGHTPTTMSEAVVTTVAERENTDVCNLQTPLFDAIDPDALDSLFRNSNGQVTFKYLDYLVTIDSDRNVALSDLSESGH